jgi:hypothetical protein
MLKVVNRASCESLGSLVLVSFRSGLQAKRLIRKREERKDSFIKRYGVFKTKEIPLR